MGKGRRRNAAGASREDAPPAGPVSTPRAGPRIADALIAEPPRHAWGARHKERPNFDDEERYGWQCTRCHAFFTLTLAREQLIHTDYQPRPGGPAVAASGRIYVPCNLDRDDVPPVTFSFGTLQNLARAGGWQGHCLQDADDTREFRSAVVCRMYNLLDPSGHPATTGYVPALLDKDSWVREEPM